MSADRAHPSHRHGLLLFVPALVTLVPAAAWGAEGYQRIVPGKPDPTVSAAAISALCSAIASKSLPACPAAVEQARKFCATPLDMQLPRPPTGDLDSMAKDQCPGPERASPFGASVKAAGLFDLGWQDALIRGLAGFLVERAKAEALAAAAERFKTGFCDTGGSRLAPLTCALLAASDPYQVPISWGTVKVAVEKDLHDLPLRMLELRVPLRTDKLKDAPELLYATVDLTEQTIAERHEPLPLFVGLRDKYAGAAGHCADQPMGCALLATGMATEVILTGYQPAAATASNFIPIAIRVTLDRAIAAGLFKLDAAAALGAGWQQGLARILAAVDAAVTRGTAAKASKKPEDIAAYVASLTNVTLGLIDLLGPSVGLTADLPGPAKAALAAWPPLLQAALTKDYLSESMQLIVLMTAVEGKDLPGWTRYLPLLAELAQAETSDQVKRVVEELAAPVGSYRGKRGAGNRKVTVNGYLGGQGGWEWLGGSGISGTTSFQGGVFAPIGIESSWGFGKSSSLGVFLSVIDLGAVVSFRTSSDTATHPSGDDTVTVSQEPQVGLAQVFSPGFYVVYGIPCTPLVLGAGGALSPELRSVKLTSTGAVERASTFRLGLFLAIDVTIFPF